MVFMMEKSTIIAVSVGASVALLLALVISAVVAFIASRLYKARKAMAKRYMFMDEEVAGNDDIFQVNNGLFGDNIHGLDGGDDLAEEVPVKISKEDRLMKLSMEKMFDELTQEQEKKEAKAKEQKGPSTSLDFRFSQMGDVGTETATMKFPAKRIRELQTELAAYTWATDDLEVRDMGKGWSDKKKHSDIISKRITEAEKKMHSLELQVPNWRELEDDVEVTAKESDVMGVMNILFSGGKDHFMVLAAKSYLEYADGVIEGIEQKLGSSEEPDAASDKDALRERMVKLSKEISKCKKKIDKCEIEGGGRKILASNVVLDSITSTDETLRTVVEEAEKYQPLEPSGNSNITQSESRRTISVNVTKAP